MASNEDCASVLEQFIHDAANLPAEINHMMEEIQAKDKDLQEHLSTINQRDSSIQKHLKVNGVLASHPKENEYAELVKRNYDLCLGLQDQKITLSEKACMLLERQVKKLDGKIRELQNDGQLLDGPPLPSVFNRKAEAQKPFVDTPSTIPLQNTSISALNANAHRINAQMATAMPPAQVRQSPQIVSATAPAQRSSAPATPASVAQHPRQREHSLGAENKRRKLGNPLAGTNLPAQPSGLRQSSLGPGTPKAGTPSATSRAGSIPQTAGVQQATGPPKKSGLTKKVISHQQVHKLKQKASNKGRLSAGRKKGQSPSVRGTRGGTAASEDADSVLSSADASETDASQSRRGRGNKKQQQSVVEEPDIEMGEDEEMEDDEGEDDKRYCLCNQRSYGEMVACENEDCPYQWFHTGCLNMKKVPDEDEDWYCPTCREKPEIIEKVKLKKKGGRK